MFFFLCVIYGSATGGKEDVSEEMLGGDAELKIAVGHQSISDQMRELTNQMAKY